jgi:hypothetical protein
MALKTGRTAGYLPEAEQDFSARTVKRAEGWGTAKSFLG